VHVAVPVLPCKRDSRARNFRSDRRRLINSPSCFHVFREGDPSMPLVPSNFQRCGKTRSACTVKNIASVVKNPRRIERATRCSRSINWLSLGELLAALTRLVRIMSLFPLMSCRKSISCLVVFLNKPADGSDLSDGFDSISRMRFRCQRCNAKSCDWLFTSGRNLREGNLSERGVRLFRSRSRVASANTRIPVECESRSFSWLILRTF